MASALAKGFIDYVNKSKSPFHCVSTTIEMLKAKGFEELKEKEEWKPEAGKKYYTTRNHSSICAFVIGKKYKGGNGFSAIAAHTDSPHLKLKPNSNKIERGFLQVAVQCYGGGLWHTWFDRDLTLAGKVIIKSGDKFAQKLVSFDKPILRIPNLAIHFTARGERGNFSPNKERELIPILATEIKNEFGEKDREAPHHPLLLSLLAKELKCEAEDIIDFELSVCDATPAVIGGIRDEFFFSPRLDNQMMCYCAIEGLLNKCDDVEEEENVRMVLLYDNEEVGSQSAYGAKSSFTGDVMRRLNYAFKGTGLFEVAMSKSFLISADMAHAWHPNYPSKHEDKHRPRIQQGPVLKYNANQSYATTSESSAIIKVLAKKHAIPLQEFVSRNDMPCGSTVGPIISSKLGMRTIDMGTPQLAMHSIREMAGTADCDHAVNLFTAFLAEFSQVDKQFE